MSVGDWRVKKQISAKGFENEVIHHQGKVLDLVFFSTGKLHEFALPLYSRPIFSFLTENSFEVALVHAPGSWKQDGSHHVKKIIAYKNLSLHSMFSLNLALSAGHASQN